MIGDLLGIVNKFIPDAKAAKALESKIQIAHSKALSGAVEADTKVRLAEMQKGGIAGIWRPLSAISVFMCLFLYWFIYPLCMIIVGLFNINVYLPVLPPLPLEFYGLATAFISIYAYGRSLEKRK